MDSSTRSSLKPSWLMLSWARSTYGRYPCHHCTTGHLWTSRKSPWNTVFTVFQDAGGLLTQEGLYFFKGCSFSRGFAGPLVLVLPGLTAPIDPIIRLPLPQSSSRFVSRHSKIRTHVVPLPNAVVSPLIYLCPNNLCRWTYPLRGCCNAAPGARSSAAAGHRPTPARKGRRSRRALTFKNCGVTRRTVATRQICSSVADLKARAIADSKPLQEGVGTRHNQTVYLRRRGRRAFFSC